MSQKVHAPKRNQWRKAFLAAYRLTGVITLAAQKAGIATITVYKTKNRDPKFAEEVRQASMEATDILEAEAIRRATQGKQPSDNLLMFVLKSRDPQRFRDNYRMGVELSGPGGGAIPIHTDGELRVIVLPSNGFEGGAATATREQRLEALTFEEPKELAQISEGT